MEKASPLYSTKPGTVIAPTSEELHAPGKPAEAAIVAEGALLPTLLLAVAL
jgi:hypothetical protein